MAQVTDGAEAVVPAAPTVLDVDTGIDDSLALLLALRSPELELVGVTCVAGNVVLEQVVRNTLGVLAAARAAGATSATGVGELPVAAGASRPLCRRLTTATFFHGADGIGGVALPETAQRPVIQPAPVFLCELARRHQGRLCVIATGPLTNIALACRLDPTFPKQVERLVVMGGAATVAGNVTPVAEANFYNDPEAAAIVFEAGFNLTMIGLDVTLQALFEARRYHHLRDLVAARPDPVARLAMAVLDFYLRADLAAGLEGSPLHDPLAVAVAARPPLVTCQPHHVEIETQGRLTAGQSVTNVLGQVEHVQSLGTHDDVVGLLRPEPNCRVALQVDTEAFLDLFCQRLGLVEAG